MIFWQKVQQIVQMLPVHFSVDCGRLWLNMTDTQWSKNDSIRFQQQRIMFVDIAQQAARSNYAVVCNDNVMFDCCFNKESD